MEVKVDYQQVVVVGNVQQEHIQQEVQQFVQHVQKEVIQVQLDHQNVQVVQMEHIQVF